MKCIVCSFFSFRKRVDDAFDVGGGREEGLRVKGLVRSRGGREIVKGSKHFEIN